MGFRLKNGAPRGPFPALFCGPTYTSVKVGIMFCRTDKKDGIIQRRVIWSYQQLLCKTDPNIIDIALKRSGDG
jgi:hypothetical protein